VPRHTEVEEYALDAWILGELGHVSFIGAKKGNALCHHLRKLVRATGRKDLDARILMLGRPTLQRELLCFALSPDAIARERAARQERVNVESRSECPQVARHTITPGRPQSTALNPAVPALT